MWMARHRSPVGTIFAFNCYKYRVQLILCHPGIPLVTLLSQEEVTQGYPILMVLYRITPVSLAEYLRAEDLGFVTPFYADDVSFDGLSR